MNGFNVIHKTLYIVQFETHVSWIFSIGNIDCDSGLCTFNLAPQWTWHHLFVDRMIDETGAISSISCIYSFQVLQAIIIFRQATRILEVFLRKPSFAPLFFNYSIPVNFLPWSCNIRSLCFLLLFLDSLGKISLPMSFSCLFCFSDLYICDSLVDFAFLLLVTDERYCTTIGVAKIAKRLLATDRLVILKQGYFWILLSEKLLIFFELLML